MSAPAVTRPQLESLLQGLLADASTEAPFVLVRGDASAEPEAVSVEGRPVDVFASDSPLAIRARLARHEKGPLAVITSCDAHTLGADLLARAVSRRIRTIDRWEMVASAFGAANVTRELAEHPAVADALIDAQPATGYRPVTAKVLDHQTALATLVRVVYGADLDSFVDLVAWAERPQAALAVRTTKPEVTALVEEQLTELYGAGVRAVFAALRAGAGAEIMPLGLVADVVAHDPSAGAAVRLDLEFGDVDLTAAELRALGRACVERVQNAGPSDPVADWRHRGDQLLDSVRATADAGRSSVLPSGFEARLGAVALALLAWLDVPADPELERAALATLGELEVHLLAGEEQARVNRLQMAARLVRWLAAAWTPAGTLKGTVADYLADGGWRDLARETVSRGDRHPDARAALAAIDGRVAELVRTHGPATARQLANAAARQDELLGVEDLLATVAARAGADVPVLVLVLDGMGWPSFLEIAGHLDRQGWHPVTAEGLPAQPAALATLPTVTEYSRTSLLCGTLRSGDGESEKRAFKELAPLRALGSTDPQLFQKKDLRQGGLDTLSEQVVSAIEDTNQRVVGVVLNNIDERLKDVEAPPSGWDLDTLTPLRELLRAARQGGRALVVTADHGHILHREEVARPSADKGGERWRATSTGPAGDGEIDVQGPRVVPEPHSCVMPWDEQIHYGPKRNGYHGGLTPVELIVPAVVLMTDDVEGWEPLAIPAPAWWYETIAPAPVEEVVPEPVPAPKAPSKKKPSAPTLFDPDPVEEPAVDEAAAAVPTTAGDWVDRLLALEAIGSQLEPLRLDEAEVASALRLLGRTGGTPVQEERLADTLGRPRARIGRFVMQLQRLLNMDGYETVASSNGAIRLDRQLLENQVGKL